jgi:hypothetical protein
MQEYLETTTLGDLIRRARGEQAAKLGTGATKAADAGVNTNNNAEQNKRLDIDLS